MIKKLTLSLLLVGALAACNGGDQSAADGSTPLPTAPVATPAPIVNRNVGIDWSTPGFANRQLVALGASTSPFPVTPGASSVSVPVYADNGLVVIQDSNGNDLYIGQALSDTGTNTIDAESTAQFLVSSGPQVPMVIAYFTYATLRSNVPELQTLVDLINSRVADPTQNWGNPNDTAFVQARTNAINAIITYANNYAENNPPPSTADIDKSTHVAMRDAVAESLKGYFTTPITNNQSGLSVYGLISNNYIRAITNNSNRYVQVYDGSGNSLGMIGPDETDPFMTGALNSFPSPTDKIAIYGPGQGLSSLPSNKYIQPVVADVLMNFAYPLFGFINTSINYSKNRGKTCLDALIDPPAYMEGSLQPEGLEWLKIYAELETSPDFVNGSPGSLAEAKDAAEDIASALVNLKKEQVEAAYQPCAIALGKQLAQAAGLAIAAPELETAVLTAKALAVFYSVFTAGYAIHADNALENFTLYRDIDGIYQGTFANQSNSTGPTVSATYTNKSGHQVTATMTCLPDTPKDGETDNLQINVDSVLKTFTLSPTNATNVVLKGSYTPSNDTVQASYTSPKTPSPSSDGSFNYYSQETTNLTGNYTRSADYFYMTMTNVVTESWDLNSQTVVCNSVNNVSTAPGNVFDQPQTGGS